MSLARGSRVGVFEIGAPLGAGGMGEVSRALDTRLKREIPLKILPESFATDPDRIQKRLGTSKDCSGATNVSTRHVRCVTGHI